LALGSAQLVKKVHETIVGRPCRSCDSKRAGDAKKQMMGPLLTDS
jgi:hypothetical protein